MRKPAMFLSVLAVPLFLSAVSAQSKTDEERFFKAAVVECTKAGGTVFKLKECDGSISKWCKISEKEQCYADQVRDGQCSVGRYDEAIGAIVGVTPRVLCDNKQ